jgi:Flp pilus assembly protein TadD
MKFQPRKLLAAARQFSPGVPHYLFALVFALRVFSLERLSRSALLLPTRGDMHFYSDWAQRILRGDLDVHGAFYGLPLYAYFLAGIYRVFGYGPFIPGLLQAAIDAGTAVLVYLLTLRIIETGTRRSDAQSAGGKGFPAPQTWAALAAIGWGLFVPAQAYSIILMPTAWFVFVFWLIVWRLVRQSAAPSWRECLGLGLVIGFTAMAIATALFLVPLVAAAVVMKNQRLHRTALISLLALMAAVGIGTAPCWIHNYFIARDPALLSAHGGVNFWIGNNPTANGYPRFPPGLRAGQIAMLEDSITSAEKAVGRPLKRAEVSAFWKAKAREYIAAHPKEWLRLMCIKLRNFWNSFQYDDLSIITNLREQGVALPGVYFGLIAIFGLPGMILAWRFVPVSRWIASAILLLMGALLTVFVTERYRLPVIPGLLVFAAYGLAFVWNGIVSLNYQRCTAYAGILAVSTIFVSWPQHDPALWALDAYNSGWQALECGNLALAETKLSLARRYVPGNPETNFALGNLRLAQGNKPAAASFYLHALDYDEKHRGALNNLAVIAIEQNRYDLAEGWLRRAEQVDPRNAKTHFLLATTLLAQGSREAAAAEIDTAIQLRPDQTEFAKLKEKIAANIP